jgi:hypothetical protein
MFVPTTACLPNPYTILAGTSARTKVRPGYKWKDNIKVALNKIGFEFRYKISAMFTDGTQNGIRSLNGIYLHTKFNVSRIYL